MDGSNKFGFSKRDLLKVAKGAALAAAGAILAYLSTQVIPDMEASGNAMLLTVAGIGSVLVNMAVKFVQDTSKKIEAPPVVDDTPAEGGE